MNCGIDSVLHISPTSPYSECYNAFLKNVYSKALFVTLTFFKDNETLYHIIYHAI